VKLLCLLPAMGLGALANELAVERSPYPLGTATTAPCLVAGVFAVWMVAGINGKHEHPDFSEIVLESPNWGKLWSATVQYMYNMYSFDRNPPSDFLSH